MSRAARTRPLLLVALGAALAAGGPAGCAHTHATYRERLQEMPLDPEARVLEAAFLARTDGRTRTRDYYREEAARHADTAFRTLFRLQAARLEPSAGARRRALAALEPESLGRLGYAVWLERGDEALRDGDAGAALAAYEAGAALAGDDAPARLGLRLALVEEIAGAARPAAPPGELASRLRALLAAQRDEAPLVPDAFRVLALLRLGRVEEAVRTGGHLARLGLDDALGARATGLALLHRGEPGDEGRARRAFERALRRGGRRAVEPDVYLPLLEAHLAELGHSGKGGLAALEAKAVWARRLFPDHGPSLHAAALGLYVRGGAEAALPDARRAAARAPGHGPSTRLLRLVLTDLGRPLDAFEAWRRSVPAEVCFGAGNRLARRLETLRRTAATHQQRPDRASGRALGAAFAACGWSAEAHLLERRYGRSAEAAPAWAALDLATAVEGSLRRLEDDAPVSGGLEAVCRRLVEVARGAGLPACPPLEVVHDEAGTAVTPDHPLCAGLLEAGVLLDLRVAPGGDVTARTASVAALLEDAGAPCYAVEARTALPLARTGLLGRTALSGRGVVVELDELRPRRALLDELERAAAAPGLGPGAASSPAAAFPRPLAFATQAPGPTAGPTAAAPLQWNAWREALLRRLAHDLLPPGRAGAAARCGPLLAARLDCVRAHEAGHVRDLVRLLPRSRHPLANLGRLLGAGLEPAAVRARYEELAEWHALAHAERPAVGLLMLVEAAADGPETPAGRAARAVLGELVAAAAARGEELLDLDDRALRAAAAAAWAARFAPAGAGG